MDIDYENWLRTNSSSDKAADYRMGNVWFLIEALKNTLEKDEDGEMTVEDAIGKLVLRDMLERQQEEEDGAEGVQMMTLHASKGLEFPYVFIMGMEEEILPHRSSIEADTIIGAIGQSTNTQFLYNDLPVKLNKWGDIEINGKTSQTSEDNIFAGGDCVTGPATVIQAVAAGRRAADAMHSYLNIGYVRESNVDYSCSRGSMEDLPRWEFEERPKFRRAVMPSIPVATRKDNFDEVEIGLSEEAAVTEARRCLKCGCAERYDCNLRNEATNHGIEYREPVHDRPYIPIVEDHPFIIRDHNKCISCGRCIAACAEIEGPDILSFYIKQGRQLVGTKSGLPLDQTDCVSCGQCVNACPCGALDYKRERDRVFRAIHNPKKTVVAFVAPAVRSVISQHYGKPFNEAAPVHSRHAQESRF